MAQTVFPLTAYYVALIGFPSAQRLIRLFERSSWARNGFRLTSSLAQNGFRLTSYYRGSYRLILGSRLICLFEHGSLARNGFQLTAYYRGSCRLTPYYRGSYRLILGSCLICRSLAQNGFRLTAYLSSAQRLMRLFERSSGANRFTATRNWVNHFHSL